VTLCGYDHRQISVCRAGATGGFVCVCVEGGGGGGTPPRNFIRSFSLQDCYSGRQTNIFLTNKTTTDIIFTCYIRNGNFGYSKFIQQDIIIITVSRTSPDWLLNRIAMQKILNEVYVACLIGRTAEQIYSRQKLDYQIWRFRTGFI
jgi:hypothetical protein